MNRALIVKELRECATAAAMAARGAIYTVWIYTGGAAFPGEPRGAWPLPFVDDDIYAPLLLVVGGLGVALGFKQTALEDALGTYRYLLHRPIDRRRVFVVKAVVGLALVQAIGGAMILSYSLWAATPGTHPSPFFWSMTETAWRIWMVMPTVYLGAAISGLRPARWYASRLLPLVGGCTIASILVAQPWVGITAAGAVLGLGCLLAGLLHIAETREY
ncbi:MAG TPA: hypothetical protein VEQ85_15845 [Lacipirellulaceae bacterium]|nr:hypothetical protein [Lacipirellulaceae bacterium]